MATNTHQQVHLVSLLVLACIWHEFNKVPETFLRDFGLCGHDSFTQLLQICRLHICDATNQDHQHQTETLIRGGTDTRFHVVYARFRA